MLVDSAIEACFVFRDDLHVAEYDGAMTGSHLDYGHPHVRNAISRRTVVSI